LEFRLNYCASAFCLKTKEPKDGFRIALTLKQAPTSYPNPPEAFMRSWPSASFFEHDALQHAGLDPSTAGVLRRLMRSAEAAESHVVIGAQRELKLTASQLIHLGFPALGFLAKLDEQPTE
jgi:hypothetical protein